MVVFIFLLYPNLIHSIAFEINVSDKMEAIASDFLQRNSNGPLINLDGFTALQNCCSRG